MLDTCCTCALYDVLKQLLILDTCCNCVLY